MNYKAHLSTNKVFKIKLDKVKGFRQKKKFALRKKSKTTFLRIDVPFCNHFYCIIFFVAFLCIITKIPAHHKLHFQNCLINTCTFKFSMQDQIEKDLTGCTLNTLCSTLLFSRIRFKLISYNIIVHSWQF